MTPEELAAWGWTIIGLIAGAAIAVLVVVSIVREIRKPRQRGAGSTTVNVFKAPKR